MIYGYTRRVFDETAMNAQSFAMSLADKYLALTAPDVRTVPFRLGDDLAADMRNNAQILRRYMDGTVKVLPADLIDAWVLSLPEPFRAECERDLSRRRGLLPVRMVMADGPARAVGLAELASEFGQLLEAIAPALADGRVDVADLPFARRILDQSDDLICAVLAVRRQVQAILPEVSAT
ncbi:hypothetical protein [Rhodanobacter sp. OR92]|uniref:hypothetical protein n=1 Tax=Rhodanobacter sp. OR92 TaxID=1076524 RepID=UPI001E426BBD|nr:hypothetical protein [Rhodanobacter sp. OR92]